MGGQWQIGIRSKSLWKPWHFVSSHRTSPFHPLILTTSPVDWCKWNEWVIEQHNRILTAWKESNRPYEWDRGLSPDQILEKGRQISKSALEEFERQKAMGWDVSKEMLDLYTEDEKLIPYGT